MTRHEDPEAEAAARILRCAGRRVTRSRFGRVWTVGLACYDRRQLIDAAMRTAVESMATTPLDVLDQRMADLFAIEARDGRP